MYVFRLTFLSLIKLCECERYQTRILFITLKLSSRRDQSKTLLIGQLNGTIHNEHVVNSNVDKSFGKSLT